MTDSIQANEAYEADAQLQLCRANIEANFLQLAEVAKKIRDKRLYLLLDHPTFDSYIAATGFRKPSTIRNLITSYEVFAMKLAVPKPRLISIGSKRLDIIKPLASAMAEDGGVKEDWLGKAEHLSRFDLINEVRSSQGRPELVSSFHNDGTCDTPRRGAPLPISYEEFVKTHHCILCGAVNVEKAHFPRTEKRGGEDWKVLPLCHGCHMDLHQQGVDTWLSKYKVKVFDYLYDLIEEIWPEHIKDVS